jgi:predicted amidophosphoribosyltransferase
MNALYSPDKFLGVVTDALRTELVPLPDDSSDVCPMCRSWRHDRFEYCSNCLQVQAELASPCGRVVPITLYRRPSHIRDWLKYYKPGDEDYRPEYGLYISAIIQRFMHENIERLISAVGQYTVVCPVPSSSPLRSAPLSCIIEGEPVFGAPMRELLRRGPGELGHRVMSENAFVPYGNSSGERVLLIDDVYTTGARAQSAASALGTYGASVAAILVVARRIDPKFNFTAKTLWDRQRLIPYDFSNALAWLRR